MTSSIDVSEIPLNAGRIVANKRGAGQDLLALRDYRPNDDLRHIDWKATAKARVLTVREFATEDDKRVTVILDDRLPEPSESRMTLREKIDAEQRGEGVVVSERFEKGVRLAASILSKFADENASLRLIIGTDIGEFGIGRAHIHESFKRLAVADPQFITESDSEITAEEFLQVLDETDDSHLYFLTANGISPVLSDSNRALRVVEI